MNLANRLTFLRIILAPVFFIIYFLPRIFPSFFVNSELWVIIVLWVIFIISELTDYFDGLAARKLNMTTDLGKLLDPFADTLVQLTYFLCFVIDGLFPALLFLLVIYREFSILFIRNLMIRKGIVLGAKMPGKIKTVMYIIAAGFALLAVSLERLAFFENLLPYIKLSALIIFILSVILSVVSFIDYIIIFRRSRDND